MLSFMNRRPSLASQNFDFVFFFRFAEKLKFLSTYNLEGIPKILKFWNIVKISNFLKMLFSGNPKFRDNVKVKTAINGACTNFHYTASTETANSQNLQALKKITIP